MTGDLLYQMCHWAPVWPWAIRLKSLGLFLPPCQVRTIMFYGLCETLCFTWINNPLLSTVCLLTENWRSPAQGSQDKTMSIPGMGIPGCSVASLKTNSEWIKRTFSLHCLSYFVLVWSKLHTLFRHPEQFWCSGAHLRAWPRFICPLTSHCPLHTFAEEIGLSFVMFCNPDCTWGLCLCGWMLVLHNMKAPKNWRGLT